MSLPARLATDAGSRPASADLLRIVRINEEIKAVVGVAFKINIMALNAIFLAKRAGTTALGFGVLSHELRLFSQELRQRMTALRDLIYACVGEVSAVLQDIRLTRLLRAAGENCALPALAGVVQRREADHAAHVTRLGGLRKELRRALDDAYQLVELGGVLAKSAKIEAAYGQSYAAALTQVSGEFDGVVEEIRSSLEALRRAPFFSARNDSGVHP